MGPHYPNFLCPNCRFVADLEADVESPEELDSDELRQEPSAYDRGPTDDDQHDGHNHENRDADELTDLLQETNLHSVTQPIAISQSPLPGTNSGAIPDGARSTTPTSNTPFALASPSQMVADGPMTPRNDAGPFVFDGTAGRPETTVGTGGISSDEFLHER
nr:hypothetical protein CFP56_03184 [Quercus suber]